MIGRASTLVVALCALGVASCSRVGSDYATAVQSCRTTIPWIVSFEKVYPGALPSIEHYAFKDRIYKWQSRAFLFDRYVMTMEIPDLVFDASNTRILKWGTPSFDVQEYTKIERGANNENHLGQGVLFGVDKWKLVEAAHGEITMLGITIKKHDPVPGFEHIKDGD